MDLINWPFAVSITVVCITIYNVVQLKLKHEIRLEAMRTGKFEALMEVEEYDQ
jgi:hypothetical protein